MAEPDAEQIGSAELVVGLVPATNDAPALAYAIARIIKSVPAAQAILIHPPYAEDGAAPPAANAHWRLVADPRLAQDRSALPQSLADSFRIVFDASLKAGARTCAVIASDPSTVTAEWVQLLLQPAAEQHFDLVAPCYALHPFEGLINRAIVYPLLRALYGKRIRNPLGPDFGISNALLERMVSGSRTRIHPLASLAVEAVTGKLQICQSHLGPRVIQGADLANLSSILAQVLGPLFLDMDRLAQHWQRARGSEPIVEFGQPMYAASPDSAVEVKGLIASFGLGVRNLPEVWGMILPPSTLVELRRLARQDTAAFRMPDETWVRIVYDFGLAHRLNTISRDQMLRALTPIYLGWVASYALEVENASPEAVEQRLERLCLAYENTKSYLIGRWRWPDRFQS
jgi:glucosylglycerate synthase